MSAHESNPAGRLWLYFRNVCGGAPNQAVFQFAAAYFGLPAEYNAAYLSAVTQLVSLSDEMEAQVALLEDPSTPKAVLLRALAPVRNVFRSDPLGTQAVQGILGEITPGVLADLEHASYALMTLQGLNPAIDEDTLSQIRTLAEEIVKLAAEDESLTPETRAAFIRFGHRIMEAADLYKVGGAQPLVDELDRFHHECRRMPMPAQRSPVWERIMALTGVVVTAVGLFTAPADLGHAIAEYSAVFEMPMLTEAPGPDAAPDAIIDAELEEDPEPESA